jgi:gluconokinase
MLLILFGLSGAGKNFVGEILANKFDYYYWDADTEMPPTIQEQILKRNLLTQDMRDEFTRIIIDKIAELEKQYPKIAISQALYQEKNRYQIVSKYSHAKLIHIKATQQNMLYRLQQRNNWVDQSYAEKISLFFESPQQLDAVITNDEGSAEIIWQFQNFLDKNHL